MGHVISTLSGRAVIGAVALALSLSACGGATPEADPNQPPDTSSAVVSNGSTVSLVGTAALKWEPPTATATAGEVTFELESLGATHNVVIEGVNNDELIVEAEADQSASAAIQLTAGTYTFFCNVTGHRAAGMEGTLTVS